ncbi:MAG: FAD-dependent oxidoreductase [Acidobacteria bacterium]|nr:FAD-dependent oxidoreductase [Acidobacteriota bacterium]
MTRAAVLGGGVIGLTSAIRLLEKGFRVTVFAREVTPGTTSDIAGAVWLPYRAAPRERILPWAEATYGEYRKLAGIEGSGVFFTDLVEMFREASPDPWWGGAVPAWSRVPPDRLPAGFQDGFRTTVPVVETPLFMPYLMRRLEQSGGALERGEVRNLADLSRDYPLVVNCSGIGARELVPDPEVFPIRGQVVRIRRPAGLDPTVLVHDAGETSIYIVPRRDDCILGGTAQAGNWDRNPDPSTAAEILRRCGEIAPRLADPEILEHRVGLRPGRREVRLEVERGPGGAAVIHNYGHGGSGFTLCWGCAGEVARLAGESAPLPRTPGS